MEMNIDWLGIEKACAEAEGLPDCIPSNAREWDAFIRQYERAVDLAEGRWHPHYDWCTDQTHGISTTRLQNDFASSLEELFYFGRGYKKSVYECFSDLSLLALAKHSLFHGVNWEAVRVASRFTAANLHMSGNGILEKCETTGFSRMRPLSVLESYGYERADGSRVLVLPKKIIGNFHCIGHYQMRSLAGVAPEWVGGMFECKFNNLTSLVGAPRYVGAGFDCRHNELTTLEGSPEHVGCDFDCRYNKLTSLAGAPRYVGGHFHCDGFTLSPEMLSMPEYNISTVTRSYHITTPQS